MQEPSLFLFFTRPLSAAGIDYAITGSVATIVFGKPRLTHDIDVVIKLTVECIARIEKAFPRSEYYVPPVEVLTLEAARDSRGHFNLIHHQTGFKCDCYLCGKDPLQLWALSAKRRVVISEEDIWFAPPEYVIVQKMRFFAEGGSDKHLRDIEGVLSLGQTELDSPVLKRHLKTLGLYSIWEKHFGPIAAEVE